MTPRINVLFLGAGKRFTLLEAFVAAGVKEKVELNLFSIEDSVKVPIAKLAKIFVGPRFRTADFAPHLMGVVDECKIDVVIPNMDAATVALAKVKGQLAERGCHAVVSAAALCEAMEDKIQADDWFRAVGMVTPAREGFPCIAKHRLGFGSRDQEVFETPGELESFFAKRNRQDYIVQKFVKGQEYTVDGYVDRAGRVVGSLSRKRLRVVDGEVDVSEVSRHAQILEMTEKVLREPDWEGPITLQFIDNPGGPTMLEINPRFGGGVTHSIHAGLDMPRWVIREHLQRPLETPPAWKDGSIMTRYRSDYFI